MNRADWMTVAAAMVGIIGIGFGLWWADAVAAIFISLDIVRDGFVNVRVTVHDLMDARPRRHDAREYHPVVEEMQKTLTRCDWVEQGAVRLREEGHVFTGEVLVVPRMVRTDAELDEHEHAMAVSMRDAFCATRLAGPARSSCP